MAKAYNYTLIPGDWNNLEYIINDLASHIVDEGVLLPEYILADGSRAFSGTGVGFKDEDNMASDSAVAIASQQSIKAFVENSISSILDEGTGQGQMLFWDDGSSIWTYTETSELFWDDTNKRIGIGTSSPLRKLEILDASNPQMRLTHTDATSYIDFQCLVNTDTQLDITSDAGIIARIRPDIDVATFGYLAGANLTPGGANDAKRNSLFGNSSGTSITTGYSNSGYGYHTLLNLTTGYSNVAVGSQACELATIAFHCFGMGAGALNRNLEGQYDIAIGGLALYYLGSGVAHASYAADRCVAIGAAAGYNLGYNVTSTAILDDTYIGFQSGYTGTDVSRCICIGTFAGYRNTNSDRFIVDTRQRSDEADLITDAILYGTMADAPADQSLRINVANLTLTYDSTHTILFNVNSAGDLTITPTADIIIPDEKKIYWGTDKDAYAEFDTADFQIHSGNTIIIGADDSITLGAEVLYFDGKVMDDFVIEFGAPPQFYLGYDVSNYLSFSCESDGDYTIDSSKVSYDLDITDGNLLTTGNIRSTGGEITTTYRMGIGTTSPDSRLHIYESGGDHAIFDVECTTANKNVKVQMTNDGGDSGGTSNFGVGGSATGNILQDAMFFYGRYAANGIVFVAGPTTAKPIKFYNHLLSSKEGELDTSGNWRFTNKVRIGSDTAPTQTLEVNGTTLLLDKLGFTQTDMNEYIDSDADGYLDFHATTEIRANDAFRCVGNVGFYNTAPTAQASGYTTFSNLNADRTCDADATTVDELADILGTLIEDLKLTGLIAA
jgi:hypothetical protein